MTPCHAIDVDRVRADTPAVADRIYLNHAGASPPPRPVLDAVIGHLDLEARTGGYEAAERRAGGVDLGRESIARLIGATSNEIAFTTSATDAWERAFWSFPWSPGDVVLTARAEYVTNAVNLLVARDRFGVEVRIVDDDEHGQIDVAALRRHLEDRAVRLVSLGHVPTAGGLVNPAVEVGLLCRSAGVPFMLDACQSVGQLVLDVTDIGCDVLVATGRKYLRGPRGTGFLFVRSDLADRLTPLGSGKATWSAADTYQWPDGAVRFESFERSIAGVLGLGAAVDYALELGLPAIQERVTGLARRLRDGLGSIDGVVVHDLGVQRCGIVTFTVDGVDPSEVRFRLADEDVHVWVTEAGNARLDLDRRGIDTMVRASVHYLNTTEELDRTVCLVERIAGTVR